MAASKEPIPQPLGKRSFEGLAQRANAGLLAPLPRYRSRCKQSVSLNQLINLKLEAPLEMAVTSDSVAAAMKSDKQETRFAVCINNSGYEASLEAGEMHRLIPDDEAALTGTFV